MYITKVVDCPITISTGPALPYTVPLLKNSLYRTRSALTRPQPRERGRSHGRAPPRSNTIIKRERYHSSRRQDRLNLLVRNQAATGDQDGSYRAGGRPTIEAAPAAAVPPHMAARSQDGVERPVPEWAKAVKSAALEAAGSSSRGSGWALSGPASSPGSAELPRAAGNGPRRRRSRAGALPRREHFDHAPVLARGLRLLHALDNVEWVADEPGERSSGGAHRCDHRKRQAIVLRRQHLAQIAGTLGAGRHASL